MGIGIGWGIGQIKRIKVRCISIDLQPINPKSGTVVVGGFPRQRDHESRYMALGPDGQLYVSFGE